MACYRAPIASLAKDQSGLPVSSAYIRRMSERLARLTAKNQQPTKPGREDAYNDADRRTISRDASNSGDCDDAQPGYYHAEFVHGPKDSTTKALPHVVTALRILVPPHDSAGSFPP